MKMNKILEVISWLKNHIVKLLIIFYFSILFILIIVNIFCPNFDFNELLNENENIINLLISSLGIGGAFVLYSDYLAKKQRDAVFGFYANMLVFLKRLNVFLENDFAKSTIMVKLYTENALNVNSSFQPTEEYLAAFRSLCADFLNFLSASKDNIPAKRGSTDFCYWYKSQINIVELLQKGTLFTEKYFGDYSSKKELERFYNQIKNDVTYLNDIINKKIDEYSAKT